MRLLHLSDLHVSETSFRDQEVIVAALLRDLSRLGTEGTVDLVIFSGDLTFSATPEQFDTATSRFLTPLLEALALPPTRLVLAHGNHDNDISRVETYLERGLREELVTGGKVNALLDNADELERATERAHAWRAFAKTWYERDPSSWEHAGPLCRVHKFGLTDGEVAVAALDTSWRATGRPNDQDKGQLLVGDRQILGATQAVTGADVTIAVMHHPLGWLGEFDADGVQTEIERTYHFLLTGHTHIADPSSVIRPGGGIVHSAAGALYESRDYLNSYTMIDVDVPSRRVRMSLRTYQPRRHEFDKAVNVAEDGVYTCLLPVKAGRAIAESGSVSGEVDRGVRAAQAFLIDAVRERSVLAPLARGREPGIDSLLVSPVFLSLPNEQLLATAGTPAAKAATPLDPFELLESAQCLVLVGGDGSGLTSALAWLAVKLSLECSGSIPIKISMRDVRSKPRGVERAIRRALVDAGVECGTRDPLPSLILAVDEIRAPQPKVLRQLSDHAKTGLTLLGCRSGGDELQVLETLGASGVSCNTAYLGPFGRKQLRELVSCVDADRAAKVLPAIESLLARGGLTRSPFMMAALVSVVSGNENFAVPGSETAVLDAYVGLLLGRSDAQEDSRLSMDYRDREHMLATLAELMFTEDRPRLTRIEIERFLLDYFESVSWAEPVSAVVDALIHRRVLLEHPDSSVSFRQPALLEIFAAKRVIDDAKFRDEVFREPLKYPSVVSHAASLRRNDEALLRLVRAKALEVTPSGPVGELFDAVIQRREWSASDEDISAQQSELVQPLTRETSDNIDSPKTPTTSASDEPDEELPVSGELDLDELWEGIYSLREGDRPIAVAVSELHPVFRAALGLSILSSVLKSSELVRNADLKLDVLRETVDGWAEVADMMAADETLAAYARDTLTRAVKESGLEEAKIEEVVEHTLACLPILLVYAQMNTSLASVKLAQIVERLFKDSTYMTQSGPALILTLLAQDIRISGWSKLIVELVRKHGQLLVVRNAIGTIITPLLFTERLSGKERQDVETAVVESQLLGWSYASGRQRASARTYLYESLRRAITTDRMKATMAGATR